MKQHEIKFVVKLQNDNKKTTMSLGFDPKQLNAALKSANTIAGIQRVSARAQRSEEAAQLRADRLREALARQRLRTEAEGYRTTTAGIRQTTAMSVAQSRIARENARAVADIQVSRERSARAEMQTQREVTRGSMQQASAESQLRLQASRDRRADLINAREAVRLEDRRLAAIQRADMSDQRLSNSRLMHQRSSVALQRSQLALTQAQARAANAAARAAGGGSGGRMFGRAASGGISLIGGNIGGAIASAVGVAQIAKTADEYSNLNARVSLVTKSEREHQLVMQGLINTANDTRVSLKGTADVYYSLARNNQALGLSQNELLGFTEAINQSITISGTSAQSANYALIQLGQAFGTGQLRGEELNSVLEQMPRLATAIAEGLGVGVPGALKTMAQKGELTVPKLLNAIKSQMAKLDAEFARMPKTIGQGLTTMKNGLMVFIGSVDKASGASHGLGQLLYDIGKKLSDPAVIRSAAAFGNGVADVLRQVGTAIYNVFLFIKENQDIIVTGFKVLSSVMVGIFAARGVAAVVGALTSMRTAMVATAAVMSLTTGATFTLSGALGVLFASLGGIVGIAAMAAAGLAWLAWNNRAAAVAGREFKKAHDEMLPSLSEADRNINLALDSVGKIRDGYLDAADAALIMGRSAMDAAKQQLAASALDVKRQKEMARSPGGVMLLPGQPDPQKLYDERYQNLKRLAEEAGGSVRGSRGRGLTVDLPDAREMLAKKQADRAIMDYHPTKIDLPGKAPKAKAERADPWDAILRKIDRAKYNVDEATDAMRLLNLNTKKGSEEWTIYKAAIDRVFGFAESPLGQANKDLQEQLPLLAIRNDAERERASILLQAKLNQRDFDPTGQYKAEAAAAAIQLQKNLEVKDEAELRNSIANSATAALEEAQAQLSVSGMSSAQAAVELELQKYIVQYKQLGLGYTEDEIRLKLAGIREQIAETERLKRFEDGDIKSGAKKAMREYYQQTQELGVQTAQMVGNAFSNAENMLVDFAMTGKMAFADFAKSVIADVIRMITKMLLMQAIMATMDAIWPGSSALLRVGASAANVGVSVGNTAKAASSSTKAFSKNHIGGIVGRAQAGSGSISSSAFSDARKFHSGGVIPGLKSGEVPIIAKSGEAVLPTVRLPNGQMGVQMAGGGGGDFSPTIPVTVNIYGGQGNGQEGPSAAAGKNMGAEIGRAVESAMNDWAQRNKKPGGSLYSMGRV